MFANRVQVGKPGLLSAPSLRELAQKHPEKFMAKCRECVDSGELSWQKVGDLRALYAALRDVPVTTYVTDNFGTRAIQSSAFPILCGDFTAKAIVDAYEGVPTIGQDLVQEMADPNKNTWVTAINTFDLDAESVKEGDPYPEMTAGGEPMLIDSRRNGRRISITKETIEENQVGDIVRRINALGEAAAEHIEELTIYKVCDVGSDVYKPNGAAEALYSGTARARTGSGGNLNTSAGLVDYTDLEAARTDLAAMKNSRGRRITLRYPLDLLIPDALLYKGLRLTASMHVPEQTTTTLQTSRNEWNLGGKFATRIISSPKLDDLSTSTWFMGNFNKQFVRKRKLDLEFATLGETTESFLTNRIAFQARVGWDVTVGAVDYVYVVKNTA